MASIRMTHELRNTLQTKAQKAFELANKAPAMDEQLKNYIGVAIQNTKHQRTLKGWYEICQANNWEEQIRTFRVKDFHLYQRSKQVSSTMEINGEEISTSEHFTLSNSIPFYTAKDVSGQSWCQIYYEHFDSETTDHIKHGIATHNLAERKFSDKARTYRDNIRELTNECTTLKQLLDVWPAAEALVPSEILQRMHVKITRAARAQQIKDAVTFDASVANQTVLTAKLLGS